MSGSPFASLRFQHPFRKYQQMILELVKGRGESDHKYHLVAPPGAGKTIVGLELIRRFGCPAVVFAPTTIIQRQWQDKVSLFTDDPDWIVQHTSLAPDVLAEINIFTYQLLSTPGENLAFVEQIAVERWIDDLLSSDQVQSVDAARQRLAILQENNPRAYRREVSKRYRRVKREFLRRGDFDGRRFLHPNARDLIDRIVALGVGTLVLDECHHLLDYWAFILRELVRALPGVRVVGLTATLPNPENQSEYENYTSLLGEVDFEVPTPAVIKEGDLAPFRDLAYFCRPSPREQDYLLEIQEHLTAAVERVTETPAFWEWVERLIVERAEGESFAAFFDRQPALSIAGVKYLLARDRLLPADIPLIGEILEPISVDDWLVLLETFGLHVLKVSSDPEYQALYRELRAVLLPFGVTISERGIRHQRSPGDLVLALSESKDLAVAEILRAELALGSRLRAVVITDYERLSARSRRLKGILDPDAGSAVRLFHHLVADLETNTLDPILVTGNVVLVDADKRAALDAGIRRWVEENRASFDWEWRPTGSPWELELAGRGKDWSSRTYVALVTSLFEQGITRCLVGTRGIFGEGWDALSLNTLVDLTSVTTSAGVRQIRGRGLRLDPAWPRKVTHNWDVVCTSPEFKKGDADLRRFVTRHTRTFGIIAHVPAGQFLGLDGAAGDGRPPAPLLEGRVARGVAHVDQDLAKELALHPFQQVDLEKYTERALAAVDEREQVYRLWRVGEPYANVTCATTQITAPREIKFRTTYTVQNSLRAMSWRLAQGLLATTIPAGLVTIAGLGLAPLSGVWLASIGLSGAGALTVLALNGRSAWQLFRHAFLELPADAILLDMGWALLAALRDAGLVNGRLRDSDLQVLATRDGNYEVFLDNALPEDSDTFSRAYRELLGPLGDARYLIERDGASLHKLVYRPLWLLLRKGLKLEEDLRAYHRVPAVLASRRERAEALAHHWRRYVGGGRLLYTRTAEGRSVLLQARAGRRGGDGGRPLAFELWK